jgi:hypothetical protein
VSRVRDGPGASARVVQVQVLRYRFWPSGMKVNGREKPWIGQKVIRRVSLRRMGWRQVEQGTRTGTGPDGAPVGGPSSPPSRPDATARGSRAQFRGETEGVTGARRSCPASSFRASRGPIEVGRGLRTEREKRGEVVVSRSRLGDGNWNAISFEANAWLSLSRPRWSNGQGGIRGEKVQTSVE